jgi:hypothetical protein
MGMDSGWNTGCSLDELGPWPEVEEEEHKNYLSFGSLYSMIEQGYRFLVQGRTYPR